MAQVTKLIDDAVFADLDRLIAGLSMADEKAKSVLATITKLSEAMREMDTFIDDHADKDTDKAAA